MSSVEFYRITKIEEEASPFQTVGYGHLSYLVLTLVGMKTLPHDYRLPNELKIRRPLEERSQHYVGKEYRVTIDFEEP